MRRRGEGTTYPVLVHDTFVSTVRHAERKVDTDGMDSKWQARDRFARLKGAAAWA